MAHSGLLPAVISLVIVAILFRLPRKSRNRNRLRWGQKMSAAFIASPEFLQTPDWKRVRYMALKANDGRCELCGRSKHDGVKLHVDHIRNRRDYPKLALNVRNLQILCEDDNLGRGNICTRDWRHPSHPHRR